MLVIERQEGKTSVHIEGERSGRWKINNTISLRLGFIFIAAWQSSWFLIASIGGSVVWSDQACPGLADGKPVLQTGVQSSFVLS